MDIKIVGFVSDIKETEEEAINNAKKQVIQQDKEQERINGEQLITKLYYVVPKSDLIVVTVDDKDKETLGVQDNIIHNGKISEFPFANVPKQIVEYKELLIRKDSPFEDDQILDVAQDMCEKAKAKVLSKKIVVVKIIDYRNGTTKLVMSHLFGDNSFAVSGEAVKDLKVNTTGNPSKGKEIIERLGAVKVSSIEKLYHNEKALTSRKAIYGDYILFFDGKYWKDKAGKIYRYQHTIKKEKHGTNDNTISSSIIRIPDVIREKYKNNPDYKVEYYHVDTPDQGMYALGTISKKDPNTGDYYFYKFTYLALTERGEREGYYVYQTNVKNPGYFYPSFKNCPGYLKVYRAFKNEVTYTTPKGYKSLNATECYKMLPE